MREWMQPLAEVAVGRAAQAVLVVERAQVAQVRADLLGRDRRVLPAGPVVAAVGREGGGAQAALADLPDVPAVAALLLALEHGDAVARVAALAREPLDAGARLRLGLLLGVGAELDEQPGVAVVGLRQLLDRVDVALHLLLVVDELLVEALQPDRPEALDDLRDVIAAVGQLVVLDDDQRAHVEAGHEDELDLGGGHARALGADERAGALNPRSGSSSSRLKPDTRRGSSLTGFIRCRMTSA
jgi:hypothetical protein